MKIPVDAIEDDKPPPRKLADILSDESKWIRGHSACDDDGNFCTPGRPDACRWCLIGALENLCLNDGVFSNSVTYKGVSWRQAVGMLSESIAEAALCGAHPPNIALWNDDQATWPQVQKVIEIFDRKYAEQNQ